MTEKADKKPVCRDCGLDTLRKLRPSQLHPGEWICKSTAGCSERKTRQYQARRGDS